MSNKSCIEIGCYPGRLMPVLGDLGYTLNGLDFFKVHTLTEFLESQNYPVRKIAEADFFAHPSKEQFDLVYSLGCIEHFMDIEGLLQRHIDLIKEDGILVIEVPNFIGAFQYALHRTFDPENLRKHHLPAMETSHWITYLETQNFNIIYEGFFGPFSFWINEKDRGLTPRASLFALRVARRLLKTLLPPDKRMYSPYCGVIAKRETSAAPASVHD